MTRSEIESLPDILIYLSVYSIDNLKDGKPLHEICDVIYFGVVTNVKVPVVLNPFVG